MMINHEDDRDDEGWNQEEQCGQLPSYRYETRS
jgi:hypothetical protein